VNIVQDFKFISEMVADGSKEMWNAAGVGSRVKIDAWLRTLRRGKRRTFSAVAPELAAYIAISLCDESLDMLYHLVFTPPVGMAIDRRRFAAFSSEQLINGHPGQFPLNIPQGHINA
jgi:hypothetical protein